MHRTTIAAFIAFALLASQLSPAQGASARWKGVWEPVNFTEDVQLLHVFFVTPEIGWAGGQGGTLIKTSDAGASWTMQFSADPNTRVNFLRFLDERTGWAVLYNGSLLRTTDGESWEEVGAVHPYAAALEFSSPTTGVHAYDTQFHYTRDGGKKWKPTSTCEGTAEVDGLNRKLPCEIMRIQFVSPTTGFALGSAKGAYAAIILRTDDGGENWAPVSSVVDANVGRGDMFFTDENTGVFSTTYTPYKTYRTTDGGKTWSVVPATTLGEQIRFADPEVGWSFTSYTKLNYTVDGGKRWSSQAFQFPTAVNAFSVPRRDVGYVVGDHGMVYRYRLLPAAASTHAKALPAMTLPPLDDGVVEQLEQLEARLEKVDEASWTEAAVAQLAPLESSVESIASEAPQLGQRYRNVNIATFGLKLLADLTGQSSGLREAFATLRQAKDSAAASTALTNLQSQIDAMKTSVEAFDVSRKAP
jgi:photosystem II stability/assembly factor-like uncharacterized protein